jgi:acyl-CoA dehydrogenase
VLELVLIIEALSEEGAWIQASQFLDHTIFGGLLVLVHGTEEQKERYLPKFANGEQCWAVGVTEANSGLNTPNMSTSAEKDGDEWIINGQKQWISGIDNASKLLLFARTTPKSETESSLCGITTFIMDPEDSAVDYSSIPPEIYFPEKIFNVNISDLRVHESQILGEIDHGLYQMFGTLNAERIGIGGVAWGAGYDAHRKAVEYANDRVVWDEPIGSHQAIQHPLADAYADLELTRLALRKAV